MIDQVKKPRHLISLDDLSPSSLSQIVARGEAFASGQADWRGRLADRVVGVYFRRTSTRTRTAFTTGAMRLGASVIAYGPNDLQENTGETAGDTARVLANMLDGLVMRTADPMDELRIFADQPSMALVNAMSAEEHPTQALADLTTLQLQFGSLEGRSLLYVGEGNNTATALALACASVPGMSLHLRTPPGFGLPADYLERATRRAVEHGATVDERHELDDLPDVLDAVYTTRWLTTGTQREGDEWKAAFQPFRVTTSLMRRVSRADGRTVFMHDLPAHRGSEVDADVLDGPQSIAFRQARAKLYSAMAVLEWVLGAGPGGKARI